MTTVKDGEIADYSGTVIDEAKVDDEPQVKIEKREKNNSLRSSDETWGGF